MHNTFESSRPILSLPGYGPLSFRWKDGGDGLIQQGSLALRADVDMRDVLKKFCRK